MAITKSHPDTDLIRYVDGELERSERIEMEQHLASCESCREFLAFIRDFKAGLGELKAEEVAPEGPCPDSWTLVSYEAGEVDEETAGQLRVHLLFCDECRDEFYALRRARSPNWTRIILRAVEGLLECVSITGSGGFFRPGPAAVALRGEPVPLAGIGYIEVVARDPETGTTTTVRVRVDAKPNKPEATVLLEATPLQQGWKACLLDAQAQEVTSAPLLQEQTTIASSLPYGLYFLNLYKGEKSLASVEVHIRND